jgi:hypothetical protein
VDRVAWLVATDGRIGAAEGPAGRVPRRPVMTRTVRLVAALAAMALVVPAATVQATSPLAVSFEVQTAFIDGGPLSGGPFTASGPAVEAGLICASASSSTSHVPTAPGTSGSPCGPASTHGATTSCGRSPTAPVRTSAFTGRVPAVASQRATASSISTTEGSTWTEPGGTESGLRGARPPDVRRGVVWSRVERGR